MINADLHMHSSFSGDSQEDMDRMIQKALAIGFKTICFTEHMDMDFPKNSIDPDDIFELDTDSYLKYFLEIKEKYSNSGINLLFGVELGLQPHLAATHLQYVHRYPFDFVIGSEHTTNRQDPYYPDYYANRSEYEAYSEYFQDIADNIDAFSDFDSLGHLDYVVRYGPNRNLEYSYSKYSDYIDSILNKLISKNIALEVNTGGFKYNLGEPNPSVDIIRRYKEFGGELITIGSDAHDHSRIGADFDKVYSILSNLGYKYYTIYENRKPRQIKL